MKKIIILLLCSAGTILVNAQKKYEFLNPPKFNDADLSKTKSLLDENAPAEILYKSAYFMIDNNTGNLHKRYFYRVKIYDKDKAEDWLNLEIPIYNIGSNRESLGKFKAFTYNLENGNSVPVKVEKSSQYKSKENKYVTLTKFAFPGVKNGSILEYQYEIVSPFRFMIPEVLIESDTPSLNTEYVFDTPINMSYNVNYTGGITPKYREMEERYLYGAQYRTYRFAYENLKGFKTEKFVRNDRNFRTKISAELNSTNFGELKLYSSSWDQIGKRLYESEDFGGELKRTKLAKENMPAGISEMKTDLEKANAIFSYVQKTFTWNKDKGIYTEDGIRKLLETKVGNAAEINLFLVMMLREAGLKADPLVISTVENGLINLVSPNISNMNFVLAAISIDDQLHIYDATSKQSSLDEIPLKNWNQYGILVTKNKTLLIQMANVKSSNTFLTVNGKINDDGSISGTYSDRDTGAYAMYVKDSYDDNAEKYKKQYKENFSMDFTDIDSKVLENGDFESSMKFSSPNLIDRVGKKMIINPMLFLNKSSNEFDQTEVRQYPIDFGSPITKVKKVTLEIPEGYVIEEMPKEKKIVTEDKEIEYTYSIVQKGNKLEVTTTTKINSSDYPKEYYPAFKQIWGVASKFENQVISLVKK
ncbi:MULTISPECIES: transglutaminase-like domain-containing protein [unclassified Chryseobacterium]|uniref:transglutaminase-like domain-containing protein n=1 Tax=unclassified Chryseobacterium TaxID=2593645 RepID=UPI000D70E17E|nr:MULTISPECIES: transglutaminase-like domain-containing protein [unclassified Chryseobacterium]PWW27600.1 transglutaminase superfamily protein [Chryseobacterium sp. AG844]